MVSHLRGEIRGLCNANFVFSFGQPSHYLKGEGGEAQIGEFSIALFCPTGVGLSRRNRRK